MANIVRAALLQAAWTGDRESMVEKGAHYAYEAADRGAQVMCFQELFNGPYFCQVQDDDHKDTAEAVPDGPSTQRMIEVAKETEMVLVVPLYEKQDDGFLYNTAAVIDADGAYLGKYRKTHIPHVNGFWEKFYFRPGNLGYPVFDTAVGRIGVYICYDRHFPEGWRALGLAGAKIVFNPSATSRGLSMYLWNLEQPASAGGQRVLRGRHQPGRQGALRGQRLLRLLVLRGPERAVGGRHRLGHRRGTSSQRPRHGHDRGCAQDMGLLPGPPSRRLRPPGRPLTG